MSQIYPDAYIVEPAEHIMRDGASQQQLSLDRHNFITNCGNLSTDSSDGRESFIQTNPKIRFIVVGMGLMGSGKSTGFDEARKYCKLLNSTSSRKEWAKIESISHDHNIVNNQNYKKNIRNLFVRYLKKKPWTSSGWNDMTVQERNEFTKEIYDIYYNTRHGPKIEGSVEAESKRKEMTRKLNLELETPGETRINRKFRLQKELKEHSEFNKFPPEQQQELLKIKSHGGSATTYRNLRESILQGKNIEYETIGSSFSTLKNIFNIIVESTNNCKDRYVYVVLGTIKLVSIQESYNQQLCRFFNDSKWFIDSLKSGGSWDSSKPNYGIAWGAQGETQTRFIKDTPGPRLGLTTTTQELNEKLYSNIKTLIETCNKSVATSPNIYKGECGGFGIDVLVVLHNPPSGKKVIATLPLSARSQNLIKSTTGESIRNLKFYHNLVIYILNNLQKKSIYGKNPLVNIDINCISYTDFPDVDEIISKFIEGKTGTIVKTFKDRVATWDRSLKMGGKKRCRKKTRRRNKRKQIKRLSMKRLSKKRLSKKRLSKKRS